LIKLIRQKDAVHRKISNSYDLWALLTRFTSKKLSLALSKAVKHSEKCLNTKSDRVYFVLRGRLEVKPTKGMKWLVARPGDAVFIKAGSWYHFKGTFTAIQANAPSFNPRNEPVKYNIVVS
jgi:ethanolamine utilization protein EutQ (cupin superfamily)